MDVKEGLTGFRAERDSEDSIVALLAKAGLELWQAPEGFWAIRAKPTRTAGKPPRRRRAQRAA